MKYELHHHTLFSLNDGLGDAKETRSFAEKNGMKAIALTDHGHMMSHEPFKTEFSGSDIKLIYGVEAYVPATRKTNDIEVDTTDEDAEDDELDTKTAHFILLAKDYQGLQCLYRMVTAGYDNMVKEKPVITHEVLNQYCAPGSRGHGHIIALSACMQGVLSVEALHNEMLEKQAVKCENKAARINLDFDHYTEMCNKLEVLTAQLDEIKERRQELNTLKAKKYTVRQRGVEKLKGTPSYEKAKAALDAEVAATEQAIAEFPVVKEQEAELSKRVTSVKAEVRKLEGKAERYQSIMDSAEKIRATKLNEAELYENTISAAEYYSALFGEGNFYVELQYHGIPQEAICFPMLANVAEELGLPVVATNDSHILEKTDDNRRARQILRSLRFNRWEEEMTGDSALYIKSDDEVRAALLTILPSYIVDQAIANTEVVAEQCNVEFPSEEHYPKFISPDGRGAIQTLQDLCNARFKTLPFKDRAERQVYIDRCRYEMKVIEKLGVADYLLIVQDFLEYGRLLGKIDLNDPRFLADPYNIDLLKELGKGQVGMSIGLGRGSAVGSLVCYLIGITDADPIKYNLLFERFLNTERVTMPKQYWAFNVNFITQRCAA